MLPGIDGVTYEDIKANWGEYGNDILRLFNIILMNKSFLIHGNMLLYNAIQRKTLIETTF